MPGRRSSMLWIGAVLAAGGMLVFLTATPVQERLFDADPVTISGLRSPRGLTPLPDGSLLVSEVLGGRLLRLKSEHTPTVIQEGLPATYGGPGEQYPTGVSAAVLVDGTYYYVVGEFRGSRYSTLYRLDPPGVPEPVAGGIGPDGFPATRLTNPYDLVAAPQGGFWVSDSGINAILHITGTGAIAEYASFPRRELSTGSEEYQFDVVPTGLTLGPDGALYLASFTGHPYPQGAAYIYRLEDHNRDGDASDPGETQVYAQGFTAATDLVFAADGTLLVTEFSVDMLGLIRDHEIGQAELVPGRLLRWSGGRIEVVADDLVSPTSVAIASGRIYVSEEFAGRVREIAVAPGKTSLLKDSARALGLILMALGLSGLIFRRILRWRRVSR